MSFINFQQKTFLEESRRIKIYQQQRIQCENYFNYLSEASSAEHGEQVKVLQSDRILAAVRRLLLLLQNVL